MFGGVFSILSKILIFIYLYSEISKLAARENQLITALVVKNVITDP